VHLNPWTPPADNLLDRLDALAAAHGGGVTFSALQRPADVDLTAIAHRKDWVDGPEGGALRDAMGAVAAVARKGGRLTLRLADEPLAELGAALEGGSPEPLPTRDLAADARWLVDFSNPNATKALHVGHLRDLALGHAIAAIGTAAGADVVRESQVGDCGRSMGEAMAGWVRFGGGVTPAAAGRKGDRLVGEWYAHYVASLDGRAAAGSPDALAREGHEHDDLAEHLLRRWRAGDAEATALLATIRDWVLEGHDATLDRLGIAFDRVLLESDYAAEMDATTQAALDVGVATRTPSGSIVHETGRPEYPDLLLNRPDGFPTQHLRYIALWRAIGPSLEGVRTIGVGGDEWEAMMTYAEDVLRGLCPPEHVHPQTSVWHGMVTVEGAVVKSSGGGGLLLDDLLDRLAGADALVAATHERVDADRLAAIAALGFCLGRPAGKRLTIDPARLLDADANAGWAMARAWAHATDPRRDGDPDPDPADRDYRFLLVQSQIHRQLLRLALERLDALALMRFYAHLSGWYLDAAPTPRLARAMRAVLGAGLEALGLIGVRSTALSRAR
jgi:arginyl-tRNA synthetase